MSAQSILYYVTPYGYYVAAYDGDGQPVEEHRGGNHPGESTAVITPKRVYAPGEVRPVKRSQLMQWAKKEAYEMASRHGVDARFVGYDSDGEESEREAYAEIKA